MADKKVTDAAWTLRVNQQAAADSVAAQERSIKYTQLFFTEGMEVLRANQQASQSLVAAQERTMQYAERFFTSGIEVLKSQEESMRALLEDLEQQVSRQREALQTLSLAPVEIALEVFSAPLAAYQRALDVAEAVTEKGFKEVEHDWLRGNVLPLPTVALPMRALPDRRPHPPTLPGTGSAIDCPEHCVRSPRSELPGFGSRANHARLPLPARARRR
jgi:hypothetical protein